MTKLITIPNCITNTFSSLQFPVCGKRYKNLQGLRYHYEHYNHDQEDPLPPAPIPQLPPTDIMPPPLQQTPVASFSSKKPAVLEAPPPNHVSGAKRAKGTPPSNYCDNCLGNVNVNKSGLPELLICCADCGRSGKKNLFFLCNINFYLLRPTVFWTNLKTMFAYKRSDW